MKLKSYFSGTVEAAIELAHQELGEEALLVNARPSTPETRYLGAYEVVFGIPPPPAAPASLAAANAELVQASAGQAVANQDHQRLAQEVAGLKRDMERVLQAVLKGPPAAAEPAADSTPCEVDPTIGRPEAARAIVAVVGPPGGGKTTTLIKLAARYGLASRKPAQILSADVFRIAAADQLRSLASILGIGCEVAETAGALAQMLEEHRSRELIFLDTPGLAKADMEDAADLAGLIEAHPEIDTHLVLPAFMRASDMARMIDQYAVFGPRKLLFTCTDETNSYADLVRVAARSCLPISFLGTGQQIPDDVEPADKDLIAEWVREESARNSSARTKGAAA